MSSLMLVYIEYTFPRTQNRVIAHAAPRAHSSSPTVPSTHVHAHAPHTRTSCKHKVGHRHASNLGPRASPISPQKPQIIHVPAQRRGCALCAHAMLCNMYRPAGPQAPSRPPRLANDVMTTTLGRRRSRCGAVATYPCTRHAGRGRTPTGSGSGRRQGRARRSR